MAMIPISTMAANTSPRPEVESAVVHQELVARRGRDRHAGQGLFGHGVRWKHRPSRSAQLLRHSLQTRHAPGLCTVPRPDDPACCRGVPCSSRNITHDRQEFGLWDFRQFLPLGRLALAYADVGQGSKWSLGVTILRRTSRSHHTNATSRFASCRISRIMRGRSMRASAENRPCRVRAATIALTRPLS